MAAKPLLLFPRRTRISYEKNPSAPPKDLKKPTKLIQSGRIDFMFKRINKAFEQQRIEIEVSADGSNPEMVLVIETRGSITDFFKVIKSIPELKWLGEYDKEFEADETFNHISDSTKPLMGKLYFVLANNSALKQLKSLWTTWKSPKQNFKIGETKWKQLFNLLYDIRPWGVKDRIEETGILEDLKERIQFQQQLVPFEIELWFRKSTNQRILNKERLSQLIVKVEGSIISETIIEEIGYHALLVEAPVKIFDDLNEQTEIQFFKSNEIMSFRPIGQSILKTIDPIEIIDTSTQEVNQENLLPPIIALLDGMPIQNNVFLQNRLIVDDPDNFEEDYPAKGRIHGTSMASLILHGDLNDNNTPLKTKLVIRPIMKYHPFPGGGGSEYIPEKYLVVDLIHRAVKDLIEGNNEITKTIKVINLSVGDRYRIFDNHMSPWAKLIDWLSVKYDILFIVSAGNVTENIEFDPQQVSLNELLLDQKSLKETCLNYFYKKNRFRKILSPAESINALTVGAIHDDGNVNLQMNNRIDLYEDANLLSPISRMGLGYRRSIKPEIFIKGGRTLFNKPVIQGNDLRLISQQYALPPGLKVASFLPNGCMYSSGTSNSAALISHSIGKIYESLIEDENLKEALTTNYFAVVAKALITHSASMNKTTFDYISENIKTTVDTNKKDLVSRFLGYGKVEPTRILECTDKRVTLIGHGELRQNEAFIYELPLPDEISRTVLLKRVIVTLAWMSPTNCDNQVYRTHKLWFDFPNNDIDSKLKATRSYYDNDTVRRGTIQHEIFESRKATAFPEDTKLSIKINCKTDAVKHDSTFKEQKDLKKVKYALIVTLEIDPEIKVDIYDKINTKIKQATSITAIRNVQ